MMEIQTEEGARDRVTADDLSAEEFDALAELAHKLGELMANVFTRRGNTPFNFDSHCLLANERTQETVRMHLHVCMEQASEDEVALLHAVGTDVMPTPGTMQ